VKLAGQRLRKLPDQPQVREAFDIADGFRAAKFRLKHDARCQRVHQPALTRDAEFFAEIAADIGDRANNSLHGRPSDAETSFLL